jgi:hypothetical protein
MENAITQNNNVVSNMELDFTTLAIGWIGVRAFLI